MPSRREAKTHYLAPNEREWSPAHVIVLDAETRSHRVGDDIHEVLRLWVFVAADRREVRKGRPAEQVAYGTTADELARAVDKVTIGNKATRLFTHNLAFDLTVTRLVEHLVDLGWKLGQWSLTDRACWFRLRKGDRGLTLCDSTTWFPAGLDVVGQRVGLAKLPLPADDAPENDWWDRCCRDVLILWTALRQFMDWWDSAGLGNWSVTGNGCGWNAMRHRSARNVVLIRKGDDGSTFERQAIYGGRRDAQRWGDVPGGPFVTVDFADAYPTLAAEVRLPARRQGRFESWPINRIPNQDSSSQIMAECEVECDEPRYPFRAYGVIWYPVGRFRTTLCGPELAEASRRGDLRHVGAGWRYFMDGHLAPWARWVLDLSHGRVAGAPPAAQLTGKRWGRSVLGRFAQRVSDVEHYGPAETVGWQVTPGKDVTSGRRMDVVDMAGERYLVRRDFDADDCFPAVFAWVESLTRVRLNRLLDEVGGANWVSCNTDGAIVRLPAAPEAPPDLFTPAELAQATVNYYAALCDRVAPLTWPLVARPKDSAQSVWLAGPQTILKDGEPVMAGIPREAQDDGEGGLSAHLWPGMAWQMEHGAGEGYVRPLQRYSVPAVTVHRWAMDDGTARPVGWEVTTSANGEGSPSGLGMRLAPPSGLAEEQSRAVARLMGRP